MWSGHAGGSCPRSGQRGDAVRVDVHDLKRQPAGSRISFRFEDEVLPSLVDIGCEEPLMVYGHVTNLGEELLVDGSITGARHVPCDRCLVTTRQPIQTSFEQLFAAVADDDRIRFDGSTVDLDAVVDESVRLVLPTQALCREECQGICPTCGHDLNLGPCDCREINVDSRFDKLKDWRAPGPK